ncbi:hypothetical protein RJ639_009225 [Escallonia herrerae]|uniref:GRAM domain-containing protein n=1 Tax=Escallonia herrerae TaxID=1293975 RepID=A0AA88VWY0_9ASTE|nr:hypothetical protein RJ639_024825 [Escallonia herrerae]KAK3012875.1 hypothetical protein RJ639_009225 [Escallonia herrerae]
MKNQMPEQAVGIPICFAECPTEAFSKGLQSVPASPYFASTKIRLSKLELLLGSMSKLGEKVDTLAHGIWEHVRIGPKLSGIAKGKLRLGARILQAGGLEKVFKQNFSVRQGEKLMKVSQCYLSTTAGPIAGLLFISTDKVAFCSDRSIKLSSPTAELVKVQYKVLIPLEKIKRSSESENLKNPSRKYIQIVTADNFEFWLMGFLNFPKTFRYLQQAVSRAQ